MAKKLTQKQLLFVQEYLKDLNATQAAIRSGYSQKSADKIGPELLGKTSVAKQIQNAMRKRHQRINIDADKVLKEIAKIAFGDLRNLASWDEDGFHLKDSNELTDADAALISQIKFRREVSDKDSSSYILSTDLKLHDKLKALTLFGQHLNLWKGKTDGGDEDPREPHVKTVLDAISKLSGNK